MILVTVDGAAIGYDASSDQVILVTVNGADVALQEVAAPPAEYIPQSMMVI